MGQNREALECAKERYILWLTDHTHPRAIKASFQLIESSISNKEFVEAALYARTVWETITLSRDSHIPEDERQWFTANGAYLLAKATLKCAENGGIPVEEMQEVGQEAIALARKSLEIRLQIFGRKNEYVVQSMSLLADILGYFNGDDDKEVALLRKELNAIFSGN